MQRRSPWEETTKTPKPSSQSTANLPKRPVRSRFGVLGIAMDEAKNLALRVPPAERMDATRMTRLFQSGNPEGDGQNLSCACVA